MSLLMDDLREELLDRMDGLQLRLQVSGADAVHTNRHMQLHDCSLPVCDCNPTHTTILMLA